MDQQGAIHAKGAGPRSNPQRSKTPVEHLLYPATYGRWFCANQLSSSSIRCVGSFVGRRSF